MSLIKRLYETRAWQLTAACLALVIVVPAKAQSAQNEQLSVMGALTPAAAGTAGSSAYSVRQIVGQSHSLDEAVNTDSFLRSGWWEPTVAPLLYQYALEAGWSLRGAPGISNHTIGDIFTGIAGAPIKVGPIQYPTTDGALVTARDDDPLLEKRPFWVFSYWGGTGSEFLAPDADRPTRDHHWIDDLESGWNLYSPPYYVTVPDFSVLGAVWRWDTESATYQLVLPGSLLRPLQGYWVFKAPAAP